MSATPAQAAAYLHLFKERRGLRPWDETNQDMRSMLTYAAQREGVVAVETLVERYPDGFSELDSLVHGAELRDAALASMLPFLSAQPPENFLPWAGPYAADNRQAAISIQRSASAFAALAPDDALAWADRNANDPNLSHAAGAVVEALVPTRPDLARQWVEGHADHPHAETLHPKLPHE